MEHGQGDAEAAAGDYIGTPESLPSGTRFKLWTWNSFRLRIAIALALALTVEGLMRSNINMAMICMVNRTAVDAISGKLNAVGVEVTNHSFLEVTRVAERADECRDLDALKMRMANRKAELAEKYSGNLIITKPDQGLIFTSFYAGGLAIVIPGGYLCDRYGAKRVVFVGAAINVIGTFLTPFVASSMHAYALVVLRFVMGCGQGILVPCMNVLIAHWFPLGEKSTAIAIATTGNQLSVILAMFLTAELCQLSFLGGWPMAFHFYAVLGMLFCLFWTLFVSNSPSKAKKISVNEVHYIHDSEHKVDARKIGAKEIPWKAILSSPTVWAIALNSFSQNFMTVGTINYIPSYYQTVLRMDLSSNGVMSALPFVIQLLTKIILAGAADYLRKKHIMTHTSVTKLFNLIASVGSAICYVLLTFCDCRHDVWAILLVTSAIGLSSGFIPGYNTSMVCVAPRYTSSVASFCRLLGQIAAVASPYMIGFIVRQGTREEWKVAFYAIAFVLFVCGIVFQVFGSASVQKWALNPSGSPAPDESRIINSTANMNLLEEEKENEKESPVNQL